MRSPLLVLVAAGAALACAPTDREARLARLERQGRALENSLDAIEVRLVQNQARIRFWRDTRDRQQIDATAACISDGDHVAAISPSSDRARVARAEPLGAADAR